MRKPIRLSLSVFVPVLVLDIATKEWVRAELAVGQAIPLIPGFRLWHRTNTGAAWSLFGDQAWGMYFLIAMGFVALGVMGSMVRKLADDDRGTAVALGALAAGALGNLIDRVRFREVTDFFDVYAESGPVGWFFRLIAGGPHYPTFNIADIGIVGGAILLGLLVFRQDMKKKAESKAKPG
jgi:signal peptidase II